MFSRGVHAVATPTAAKADMDFMLLAEAGQSADLALQAWLIELSHALFAAAGSVRMETASRQAAERSHTAELAQLHLKPTSRWPPDLQRLVEQRESAAAEVSWSTVMGAVLLCLPCFRGSMQSA